MNRHHTTRELADAIGVSIDAIQVRIKRGQLRAIKVGRDWLIPPDAYGDAVKAGRFPAGRKPKPPQ